LAVLISTNFKPSKQCIAAATKPGSILRMIYIHFQEEDLRTRYKAHIHQHLEYCSLHPSLVHHGCEQISNGLTIERCNGKPQKLVTGSRQLSYKRRLEQLHLTTLENNCCSMQSTVCKCSQHPCLTRSHRNSQTVEEGEQVLQVKSMT